MQLRYEALLWVPDRRSGTSNALSIGHFRSQASAERAVEKALAKRPAVGTRFKRERFPYMGTVYDLKLDREVASLEAPERIVPSVGERGYW